MLCMVLLQGTANCWIVAAFYLNRNYIASTLCINRFDLIPVCKGSCFLDLKLTENNRREEKSPDIKYKEILLFCEHYTSVTATAVSSEHPVFFCGYLSPYFPLLLLRQVFRPPASFA